MTDEIADIDETAEGEGPYEKGLWAEARHWVGWLVNIYGNVKEIALVGLSRRAGLRCKNWLWSIEGIVRRLIIAAALAFDPASLKPSARSKPKTAQQKPEPPAEPQRPASNFRVLGLHGRPGASRGPQASQARMPPPDHRHLSFPVDDLLWIGPVAKQPARRAFSAHRPHPLDRRGRISRWDPDYRGDPEKEAESYRRHFFGPFPVRPDRFSQPPRERKHRDIHDPFYRGKGGGMEFRRIEEEWRRVIPAPDLAGRIMALHRVMLKPELWIARTARLLQTIRRLPEVLRTFPAPKLAKPKRDRGPGPPGLDILDRSHAALVGLDTS